jgi:hypothetical protein
MSNDFSQLDLNIDNYGIDDLLNVFQITPHFDVEDLKSVKRKALQFHPDKSNLPHEYFLFFMTAYKIIKDVWIFKNTKGSSREILEFEDKESLDIFFKNNKGLNFHTWFNETFDKVYVKDEKGYEQWFRQEEEEDSTQCRQNNKIQTTSPFLPSTSFGYDLVEGEITDYSSCHYSDLMEAHTRTQHQTNVEENIQRIESVSQLEVFRQKQQQSIIPLSESESVSYFEQETRREDHEAIKRAYELARQSNANAQRKQLIEASWKRLNI